MNTTTKLLKAANEENLPAMLRLLADNIDAEDIEVKTFASDCLSLTQVLWCLVAISLADIAEEL